MLKVANFSKQVGPQLTDLDIDFRCRDIDLPEITTYDTQL